MWSDPASRSRILIGALAVLLLVVEHVNGRAEMNDFRVYYGAAESLRAGAPLYGVSHGLDSGVFKYAPVMALLFIPFTWLPYGVAAGLHFLLIAAAFSGALLRADRLVRTHLLDGRPVAHLPLLLTLLVTVVHLHRELHLGNVNVMLLWLLLVALDALLRGRDRKAGVLIGLAVLAKPHFIVLVPWLLLHRRWRTVAFSGMAAAILLVLPAIKLGSDANVALHWTWLGEMARHNAFPIHTGGEGYEAVNTIYSFLWRAVLQHTGAPAGTTVVTGTLALIAGGVAALMLANQRSTRSVEARSTFEFLLLVALVPSITLTDTEHFLLALPLVNWLVHHLVPRADPRWMALAAVPVLFAFGGNWADALGSFSDTMVHYGVLGIGNLGLLALGTWLYLCRRSNAKAATPS